MRLTRRSKRSSSSSGGAGTRSSTQRTAAAATPSRVIARATTAVSKFLRGVARTIAPHQTKIREISDSQFEKLKAAFISLQPRKYGKKHCPWITSDEIKDVDDLISMYLNAKRNEDLCFNTTRIKNFEKMVDAWVLQ